MRLILKIKNDFISGFIPHRICKGGVRSYKLYLDRAHQQIDYSTIPIKWRVYSLFFSFYIQFLTRNSASVDLLNSYKEINRDFNNSVFDWKVNKL